MDQAERKQVGLLLEHLSAQCRDSAAAQMRKMVARHSASGSLQSGRTVRVALQDAEDAVTQFVKDAVRTVADVALDIEAFHLIRAESETLLIDLKRGVDSAAELATGGVKATRSESVALEADRLFGEARGRVQRLLDIHAYTFTQPAPSRQRELTGQTTAPATAVSASLENKGGKPLAAHWDAMWAHIAISLWTGDLEPKTQADVKAAMLRWFGEQGIDIGDTAVTQRAREFWRQWLAAQ